ncbi:MAG TPA: hypothetical protein VFO54_00780 [Chryseosolibacter sp.]|nr:hypothetical protein [Chryseosolibacter sp.]
MLELATKPFLKLGAVASLLDALHQNDIQYCHWKSNEHLAASMLADTDLDILFAEDEKERLEKILHKLGFKRFDSIGSKQYKDIVDYLGMDAHSGKVIHLHTHYRLSMGEPYLKSFQFKADVEGIILKNRIFNEEFGIYCIQPAIELILLYIREALKLRHRDVFARLMADNRYPNKFVLAEYRWLKNRTSEEEVYEALKTIFNGDTSLFRLVTGEFSIVRLRRLASVIKNQDTLKRLYSPIQALAVRWYREGSVLLARKLYFALDRPTLFKRTNPRGGLVVSVIGADGSGKSTVTGNLKNTFEPKLDIYKIYFGRGDGKASPIRRLFNSAKTAVKAEKKTTRHRNEKSPSTREKGFARSMSKCIEALLVAREKRENLRLMQAARNKGALVICDRYPQNQIWGYNDGPLLHDFLTSRNPLLRLMAKIESRVYAEAENHPPDIVFKLIADAEVVERRKPGETSMEKLRTKINGIKQLRFKDNCKVVTIDATRPLSEVLNVIKQNIWNAL